MRVARPVVLKDGEREILVTLSRSRTAPARLVERAQIVLLAAEGKENRQIAETLEIMPETVARWRNRFLAGGLADLEKDAPRPGRKPVITAKVVRQVVEKTTREQPDNATHWSTRTMAKAMGISEKSVRRISPCSASSWRRATASPWDA